MEKVPSIKVRINDHASDEETEWQETHEHPQLEIAALKSQNRALEEGNRLLREKNDLLNEKASVLQRKLRSAARKNSLLMAEVRILRAVIYQQAKWTSYKNYERKHKTLNGVKESLIFPSANGAMSNGMKKALSIKVKKNEHVSDEGTELQKTYRCLQVKIAVFKKRVAVLEERNELLEESSDSLRDEAENLLKEIQAVIYSQ